MLAVASHGQPFSHYTWAYSVADRRRPRRAAAVGAGVRHRRRGDVDGERRTLLLTGKPPHEPAAWKRYRGGATGRMWLHGRAAAARSGRAPGLPDVRDREAGPGSRSSPTTRASATCTPACPDGSDLRRHTDHADFYARHAATDGTRVVYQCAGELWLVEDFSARTAGRAGCACASAGRAPAAAATRCRPPPTSTRLAVDPPAGRARCACAAACTGSPTATARPGPSPTPRACGCGCREMLGDTGQVAYVTDAEGEDAHRDRRPAACERPRSPRRIAAGLLGRVRESVASPNGETVAVATHDGRLLLVDVRTPEPARTAAGWQPASAPRTSRRTRGRRSAPADGTPADGDETRVTELVRSANGPVPRPGLLPRLRAGWPGRTRASAGRCAGSGSRKLGRRRAPCHRRHRRPVRGRAARLHPRRPLPGVPVLARLRPGLRRAHRRPVLPAGLPPVPGAADLGDAVALRAAPRRADRRPAAWTRRTRRAAEGTVLVEAEGLASRVTPFPVAASKYSALRPVSGGGLVWLRWPISGALGETFANPDDTSGRPTLEHFDLARARAHRTRPPASTGSRSAATAPGSSSTTRATARGALPTSLADADTTVHLDLRRILHEVDPAAEWRQAYEEAGRLIRDLLLGSGHVRHRLGRGPRPVPAAGRTGRLTGRVRRPAARGAGRTRHLARLRLAGPPQRGTAALPAADRPARRRLRAHRGRATWPVTRILPGDSSDSKARSPLAGSGIREGAVLTHVDGRPVDPVAGPCTAAGRRPAAPPWS